MAFFDRWRKTKKEVVSDNDEQINSEVLAAEEEEASSEAVAPEEEQAAPELPVIEEEQTEPEIAEAESAQENTEVTESNGAPQQEETPQKVKESFFAKLKRGLGKTREALNDKVDSVLKVFKKIDEELFEELEEVLILADVGMETSMYIIEELRKRVKEKRLTESTQLKEEISEVIAEILSENDNSINLSTSPAVIMVIGVNGVGKTTSIGKMAARYIAEGKSVVLGAADTFRAAAIDQLQIWADRVGADIVKHEEGSDPASVVFDTIAHAKSQKSDVIIIDTAGRLHNKKNLMDELGKMSRIIDRELPGCSKESLLVLDATTGQNAVNQTEVFKESAGITGIILTKLDGSAKGGIVLAIAHEHSIPVKLVGVGEGMDDLQSFEAMDFAKSMLGE